ncbi:MAG: hypothetical protein CMI52_02790 [Parcubacteria group bacterium]|nr:hypothetical protein [Parcubacteria group bacterium]|tara:strand:+ start:137 stop:715 length:579 start_codon:yes stop_codon:yes gene_type:complete
MREELFPHDKIMAVTFLPLIPRWVTPNAITIARFALTPLVVFLILIENYNIGIPLFVATAFTDVLDGSLARVRKKVTEWGTLYDPVADKLLIGASLAVLVVRYIHPIIAVIIIMMELIFLAGGYRKKCQGKISCPSWYGKFKMMFQTLGVTLILVAVAYDISILVLASTVSFLISITLGIINVIKYGVNITN